MITAAVLCPGPSVEQFSPDGFELIVGVNRVAGLFACHYWCMLDHYTYDLMPVIGRPTIVCPASTYNSMCKASRAAKAHVHLPTEQIDVEHGTVNWRTWSATCAIITAFWKGARDIRCYGMDWSGANDWDGFHHDNHRRSVKRWDRERLLFAQITDLLAARGCALIREGQGVTACR